MTDIRARLPECPLEYEVPPIPGTHTALVIAITAADIDWQERMLPWTLASLINNTDLVMQGVHLKITSDTGWVHERVQETLKRFDLPQHTCIITSGRPTDPLLRAQAYGYDIVHIFDINHWAFRDGTNQFKLTIKDLFSLDLKPATPSEFLDLHVSPYLCNMEHATIEDFRRAIKHLMGAQLAMKI